MDKRKGIILAIVLFLIIGLGSFVFAGSSDSLSGDDTNGRRDPVNSGDGSQEDLDDSSEGEGGNEEGSGNETDNDGSSRPAGGNGSSNGDNLVINDDENQENENPSTPTEDDSAYDAVLALIESLEQQIKDANSKNDLNEAADYRDAQEVAEKLADLADGTNKTDLEDRLDAINEVLNDFEGPVIGGIENDEFTNENVTISIEEENVTITLNGEEVTLEDLKNLSADNEYTLVATDNAFNSTEIVFTIDKTVPSVGSTDDRITDGTYHPGSVPIRVSDTNLASITVNGEKVEFEGTTWEEKFTSNGTYEIVVTDKAGNSKTFTFTVDKKAPLLVINGETVEPTDETLYYNTDLTFTVEDNNFASFVVNGHERNTDNSGWTATGESGYNIVITDKAGNTNTYNIVIDKTAIALNHLYILNNSHNDYEVAEKDRYKVIGNGQDLYVELVLKEQFAGVPVITVGNSEPVEMTCNIASWNEDLWKCDAHITITEDMGFANGDEITFDITGVKDIAGNVTVIDETSVTTSDKYGKVIYDNEAPIYSSLGLVNITHYKENSTGDNLFVANVGDTLRAMISFDELLTVNPTITIGGVTKEMHLDEAWTDYSYWADIEITEDMDLSDGNIDFIISDYADAAGNVGTDLTNKDIKDSSYTGVEFDTTAPTVKFPATHNYNKYYNKEFLTVTITEENLAEVYYTWSNTNKYVTAKTLVPEENIIDNADGTYTVNIPTIEGRNRLNIKAVDKAGNIAEAYSSSGAYNIDKTNPEITLYKWMDDGKHQKIEPSVHNYCVIAEAADTNLAKITLNGNDYTNGELICANGSYELVATDKAGLTKTINFEIDTEYGSVIINETDEYNTYDLDTIHKYNKIESMTFSEEGTVRLSLNDEVVYYGSTEEFNYTFVDGIYKVELFDKGGNPTVVMFELDSVAPQVVELRINSSNDDKGYANETHSVGIYLTVDEKLASDPVFTIDGKEYSKNQGDEDKNFYAVVTNLPETTTEGEIKFTIEVEDEFGNVATFTNEDIKNDVGYDKVIFDTTAPELTLVGKEETYDNVLRVEAGTEITLEDVLATATDASFDGEITVEPYEANFYANTGLKDDNIYGYDFSNGFDTRKPTGSRYNIYYKVTDKAGNTTEDVMILAISDTTAATITPNQDDNYHVEYGSEYSSVTATVTDNVDETEIIKPWEYIRFDFQFNNLGEVYTNKTFDTTLPGRYLAIWDYTDSSGNVSDTLKRWVIVSDTTAPALAVDTVDNEVSISDNPQVHATDLQEFEVVVKLDGKEVRRDKATLNSEGLYSVWFGIGYLADGEYVVEATDASGNTSKVEFTLIRLNITDSDVGSNLIDTSKNTINNFNSFAIKFNKDITIKNYSLTNGFRIEMEYSTDGINYQKSGTTISNFWTEVLGSSPTEKYQGSSFTIAAGSPIYWSGGSVAKRYADIYNAILATANNDGKVYVRTVFTVIQPEYTKSFTLKEIEYSKGGTEVSERGLADFN